MDAVMTRRETRPTAILPLDRSARTAGRENMMTCCNTAFVLDSGKDLTSPRFYGADKDGRPLELGGYSRTPRSSVRKKSVQVISILYNTSLSHVNTHMNEPTNTRFPSEIQIFENVQHTIRRCSLFGAGAGRVRVKSGLQ